MLRSLRIAPVLLAMLLAAECAAGAGFLAWLEEDGKMSLRLSERRGSLGEVSPGLYGPNWTGFEERTQEGFPKQLSPDAWQYAGRLMPEGQQGSVDYLLTAKRAANGIELDYEFRTQQTLNLNAVYLRFRMPVRRFAGRQVVFPDTQLTLPGRTYAGNPGLYYGRGRSVTLSLPEGDLRFTLGDEMDIELQDDREWGDPSFSLSLHFFHSDQARSVPAGSVFRQSLVVESEGLSEILFQAVTRSQTDITGWFPFDLPRDMPATPEPGFEGPVDFSDTLDRPAGRHGFLQVRGEHFAFADGTPVKFWGVNVDTGAALPEKAEAPLIARRMAQLGINIARFILDRPAPRGLIAAGDDTRQFDPEMLDRMDYFVSCLKERGIYTRLDLWHYRQFLPGDGVEVPELADGRQPYCGGPAMYFQPRIEELHREYAEKLLLHRNPYTGLRYVDEPALAFLGIVNENTIFLGEDRMTEGSRRVLEGLYQEWLKAHPQGERVRFLAELEERYYERMRSYLRQLGVKTPIGCTNLVANTAHAQLQAAVGDHMEFNTYWDHPHRDWRWIWNQPMLREGGGVISASAAAAPAGKPFAITEINYCDTSYRQEAPLLTAAYACLQGWDAVLWWDYNSGEDRAGNYDPFAGTTPMFTIRDNPMMLAQFGAASLAFRRGYISPARTAIDVSLADADVFAEPNWIWQMGWNRLRPGSPFAALPMICRLRSSYPRSGEHQADLVVRASAEQGRRQAPAQRAGETTGSVVSIENPVEEVKRDPELVWRLVRERMRGLKLGDIAEPGAAALASDTGELSWNTADGVLTINAPQFQAAVGSVAGQTFRLADFTLELTADKPQAAFAAISLCSLDGRPLKESARILLTAVGRAEDTGQVWEEGPEGDFAAIAGTPPVLAEPVRGRVSWQGRRLRAFPLSPSGKRLQEVLPEEQGVGQALTIGESQTLWYELVAPEGR